VAGDREQARIVFGTCKEMVEGSPRLNAKLKCYKNSIVNTATLSSIKVISAEAYSKHGYRPYGICFDEMHVQPNRELYDTLTRGMIKREGSMCWMITTAGVKNTFAETIHDYAHQVQNKLIDDPSWLPVIYTVDIEADPFDEKNWIDANPGLGTILNLDNFRILAREAQNNATALNGFKRLHLNIWTGSTQSWIPPHVWDKCDLGEVEESELQGAPCWAGLDLASTRDLSSFAIIWEIEKDAKYLLRVWFWCPADTVMERTLKENANYEAWVQNGLIFTTPGNVTDQRYIKEFILEMHEKYGFSIGYDRYMASQLMGELYSEKEIEVRAIPQTISRISEPSKWLEKAIYQKWVNHEGNKVLAWQADNVEIYRDNNDNIRPDKKHSKDKIDGIAASVTAIAQMLECKREQENSVYEEREIRFL
jgi:phage terminase large subunit-like protein